MKARAWIAVLVGVVVALLIGSVVLFASVIATGQAATQSSRTENDDDFGSVEVHDVNDEGALDPPATGLAAEVWETFTRVATPEVTSSTILEYHVGNAPKSDTLAYVYQDSENPQYWILAVNLATSENRADLIGTLVHEYAHIMTLGLSQVSQEYTTCHTIVLDEGCADPGSAIEGFQAQFWAPYGDSAPALDNSDSDVGYDFYLAHEDDFVDDYAATNAVEDIAETFMTWVVQDDPTGSSVVADKFAFLATIPELVAERERIRAEFADELGLSV